MIDFYFPTSVGEWLAFGSAAVTVGFGLVLLAAPRISLALLRLQTAPDHPEAVSEARGTMAGFYLGTGLAAILFAQPLLYIALGAGWAFTAFGRLVSMLADRGVTRFNVFSFLFEITLAGLPLGYSLGFL